MSSRCSSRRSRAFWSVAGAVMPRACAGPLSDRFHAGDILARVTVAVSASSGRSRSISATRGGSGARPGTARRLLCLLLVHRERAVPVRRDRGRPLGQTRRRANARNAVQMVASRLRAAIGDGCRRGPTAGGYGISGRSRSGRRRPLRGAGRGAADDEAGRRPGPRGCRDAAGGARAVARARRWPTWQALRLRSLRSRASRRCACDAPPSGSRPTSRRVPRSPAELEALVAEHPLGRARCASSRCGRLYRAGRQADALAVYRDAAQGAPGAARPRSPGRRCASSKRRSSATRSNGRDLPGRRRTTGGGSPASSQASTLPTRLRSSIRRHSSGRWPGTRRGHGRLRTPRRNRVRAARRRRSARIRHPGRQGGRPAARRPGSARARGRGAGGGRRPGDGGHEHRGRRRVGWGRRRRGVRPPGERGGDARPRPSGVHAPASTWRWSSTPGTASERTTDRCVSNGFRRRPGHQAAARPPARGAARRARRRGPGPRPGASRAGVGGRDGRRRAGHRKVAARRRAPGGAPERNRRPQRPLPSVRRGHDVSPTAGHRAPGVRRPPPRRAAWGSRRCPPRSSSASPRWRASGPAPPATRRRGPSAVSSARSPARRR